MRYREWNVDPKPTISGLKRNKDRIVSGSMVHIEKQETTIRLSKE